MVAPHDGILAVVIGDDAVAAGMLALDLVQAGFDAHGAGDIWAATERLRDAPSSRPAPVLVAVYDDLRRTLEVWRHLQDEGVRVRVVVAVQERDIVAAEAAAMAGGWLGVVPSPVQTDALIDLLDQHASGGGSQRGVESGDLARVGLMSLLERELLNARRDPARGNCTIRVESQGLEGMVALTDGELVHAEVETNQGRHALERMACWQTGTWTLRLGRYPGEATLTGPWRGTLAVAMEYARRVAEARRTMPLRDHVCTVRWERVRPLPVVAEALFRRLASGMPLRAAMNGRGDDELEAYAALRTRIRRGAVTPLEQTVTSPPSRHPTHPHQRPTLVTPAPAIMRGVAPANERHIRTSESHRRPRGGHTTVHGAIPAAAGLGAEAFSGLGGGVDGTDEREHPISAAFGPAPTDAPRHKETATYQSIPLGDFVDGGAAGQAAAGATPPQDLPEIAVDAVRENTPTHTPVLPTSLPEVDSDAWDAASAAVEPAASQPVYAATGWFGLNVGKTADPEAGARVNAMRDALVQGGEQAAAAQLEARMSQSVAELPRVVVESDSYESDEVDSHYALFASDEEIDTTDGEIEDIEAELALEAAQKKRAARARFFWISALAAVAAALVLVIWPASPLYQEANVQPAAVRSYERAVELADAGKEGEAIALLRLVHGRKRVAPEATLQLAVLELRSKQFTDAQAHLRAYVQLPDAARVEEATRLYRHVFGAAP